MVRARRPRKPVQPSNHRAELLRLLHAPVVAMDAVADVTQAARCRARRGVHTRRRRRQEGGHAFHHQVLRPGHAPRHQVQSRQPALHAVLLLPLPLNWS